MRARLGIVRERTRTAPRSLRDPSSPRNVTYASTRHAETNAPWSYAGTMAPRPRRGHCHARTDGLRRGWGRRCGGGATRGTMLDALIAPSRIRIDARARALVAIDVVREAEEEFGRPNCVRSADGMAQALPNPPSPSVVDAVSHAVSHSSLWEHPLTDYEATFRVSGETL